MEKLAAWWEKIPAVRTRVARRWGGGIVLMQEGIYGAFGGDVNNEKTDGTVEKRGCASSGLADLRMTAWAIYGDLNKSMDGKVQIENRACHLCLLPPTPLTLHSFH